MISLVLIYLIDVIFIGSLIYFVFIKIKSKKLNKYFFWVILLIPIMFLSHLNIRNWYKYENNVESIFRVALFDYYQKHKEFPKKISDLNSIPSFYEKMNEYFPLLKPKLDMVQEVKNDTMFYILYAYGNDFDNDSLKKILEKQDPFYLLPLKDGDIIIKKSYFVPVLNIPNVVISDTSSISEDELRTFFRKESDLKKLYSNYFNDNYKKIRGYVLINFIINEEGRLINFKYSYNNSFEKEFAQRISDLLKNKQMTHHPIEQTKISFPFIYY